MPPGRRRYDEGLSPYFANISKWNLVLAFEEGKMKSLKKEEVRSWCQHRSVKVTSDDYLYFDAHERLCIAIELPEKPYQLVALANALLPYTESVPFQGAVLWIRQWGV